jgi:FkbM family methyltransferase
MSLRRVPLVGPFLAERYRKLPSSRRLRGLEGFGPKRLLQLRRLVPGADRIPITVVSPEGLRMRFTRDPLDERITEDVFGRHRRTYFPDLDADPDADTDVDADTDGAPPTDVLDLGAHHGQYALLATVEYPGAHVIAVEPGPTQAAALRQNVHLNSLSGRVTVLERALSDRSGTAQLNHDATGSWGDTLFDPAATSGSVEVVTSTLREIVGSRSPDVIKCNAEGAEYALVDQLPELDPPPRLLVLMVHDEHGDPRALREAVTALGYRIDVVMVGDHPTWHCTRASDGAPTRPAQDTST